MFEIPYKDSCRLSYRWLQKILVDLLEEMGRDEVNQYEIYTKFVCKKIIRSLNMIKFILLTSFCLTYPNGETKCGSIPQR